MMGATSPPMDVSGYFRDPDGDTLSYSSTSDDTGVATVNAMGNPVMVTGVAVGTANITVKAMDPDGAYAEQMFMVTVTPAMLGAPMNVMAEVMVDDADPGDPMTNVKVTWTDGENSDAHWVGLYDVVNNRTYSSERVAGDPSAMTHTFTNVPDGVYLAAVIATPKTGDDSSPMVNYARMANGNPMLTVIPVPATQ